MSLLNQLSVTNKIDFSLNNPITTFKNVVGVEMIRTADGTVVFNAVQLKSKRHKVSKEKKIIGLSTWESLTEEFGSSIPISLTVAGKGIFHRQLSGKPDKDTALKAIFPEARAQDFFIELFPLHNSVLVSIARKDLISRLVADAQSAKLNLMVVSFGWSDLNNIIPFLNSTETLQTLNHTFHLSRAQEIIDVTHSENLSLFDSQNIVYIIGRDELSSGEIMAFSCAMKLLLSNPKKHSLSDSVDSLRDSQSEYFGNRLFKLLLFLVGVFFLVTLLISFFTFNHFSRMNNENQAKSLLLKQQRDGDRVAKEELEKAREFLIQNHWTHNDLLSVYADRIGALVPEGVVLTSLIINPERNADDASAGIAFESDTVLITGKSFDPTDISQFAADLKISDGLTSVSVESFSRNLNGEEGDFKITALIARTNE